MTPYVLMSTTTPPLVEATEDCAWSLYEIRFIVLLTSVQLGTQVGRVLVQISGFVRFAMMQCHTKSVIKLVTSTAIVTSKSSNIAARPHCLLTKTKDLSMTRGRPMLFSLATSIYHHLATSIYHHLATSIYHHLTMTSPPR